jgi:hypothetical protein
VHIDVWTGEAHHAGKASLNVGWSDEARIQDRHVLIRTLVGPNSVQFQLTADEAFELSARLAGFAREIRYCSLSG